MKRFITLFLIISSIVNSFAQLKSTIDSSKRKLEIIGYFPNWQHYKRNGLFKPKRADFSKYTIINYAFMSPDANGTIVQNDPWSDAMFLEGEIDWDKTIDPENPAYVPYSNMVDHCHAVNTQVVMSLGGWTLSTEFPKVAADPVKRAHFAQECVRICKKWNLDGIDIDWEFPGASPGNGTIGGPADTENFNLMLGQIRDSLDVLETKTNRYYMLTAAFHSVPSLAKHVDWKWCSENLDYINLFGYDFYGAWDSLSNHNAPLYAPKVGDEGVNQHDGMMLLVEKYGVPREKLILGIGFYGRKPDLHKAHSKTPDTEIFSLEEGTPSYFSILQYQDQFDIKWDSTAQVPYMTGKTANTFVSYDDQVSVRLKAEHIIDEGVSGCLIWDCAQDWIEAPIGSGQVRDTPLLNMINEVFYLENNFTR